MKLTITYNFLSKQPTTHAAMLMDHFGIGFETGRHVVAENLELPIRPGDVVCFTGASGSGKSSLLRAAAEHLQNTPPSPRAAPRGTPLINIDSLPLPDTLLVDALDLPFKETLKLLSACGLGEAHLMLRSPDELSDGQRYRFRLALALARTPPWILADEFTATLDRTLAQVVAFNVRRLADRTGTGFLLATTHEDILHDLQPTLHVSCRLDGRITWTRHNDDGSVSHGTSGSAPAPEPTGRTSLGGITEATTSEPSAT